MKGFSKVLRLWIVMVITGLVAGSIALMLAIGYARWLDDPVIADVVL